MKLLELPGLNKISFHADLRLTSLVSLEVKKYHADIGFDVDLEEMVEYIQKYYPNEHGSISVIDGRSTFISSFDEGRKLRPAWGDSFEALKDRPVVSADLEIHCKTNEHQFSIVLW